MIFKYPPSEEEKNLWSEFLHSDNEVLRVASGSRLDGNVVKVVGVDHCSTSQKNKFVCCSFSRKNGTIIAYALLTVDNLAPLTKKEHAIEQMLTIFSANDAEKMARALYDAGYRKIIPQLLTPTQTLDQFKFDHLQPTTGETK